MIDQPHSTTTSLAERICLSIAASSAALLTICLVLMGFFVE